MEKHVCYLYFKMSIDKMERPKANVFKVEKDQLKDFRNSISFNFYRKDQKCDKTFKNIKRTWNFTPYMLDSNQPYLSEQNSRGCLHLDFGQHFISVDKKKSLLIHADSDLIPLPATKIYYSSVL